MVDARGLATKVLTQITLRAVPGQGIRVGNVRFGVALPREIVEKLDMIAKDLNVSRSKVIEMAVFSFINYLEAMKNSNNPLIIVIMLPTSNVANLLKILEEDAGSEIERVYMEIGGAYSYAVIKASSKALKILEKVKKIKGLIYPIISPPWEE